jgi:hypothetical protein
VKQALAARGGNAVRPVRVALQVKRALPVRVGHAVQFPHPADILAVVDDQFSEMRKQLDFQIQRTDELQRQIDLQRQDTTHLRQQLEEVHRLLKDLMKTTT